MISSTNWKTPAALLAALAIGTAGRGLPVSTARLHARTQTSRRSHTYRHGLRRPPLPKRGRPLERREASSDGIVVAASPYAAHIGAEVLARGGNAVDAAVATAFALTVAEPGMNGLGGRTVMIVGFPGGRVEGLNGATAWPRRWIGLRRVGTKVSTPHGWGQIAVPGTLAALAEAARRWGTLRLSELIRPAVYLARDGFIVSDVQGRLFEHATHDLAADPALRRIFLHPDGTPYRAGERLAQPDLARTLERIAADGPAVFYRGPIARAIDREMARHGGYVSAADLAAYRARPAIVDRIRYGPYTIAAVDKPAMGRALLWRMRVLNRLPRYTGALDDLQATAELLAQEPPPGPSGETDAAQRARLVSGDSVMQTEKSIEDQVRAHVAALPTPPGTAVTHTTHLVAADRRGCVVSLTQSLGPFFGAKVALPGYGVTFAATMGYLDDQDVSQGPVSSIAPTLVFDAGGRPCLAVGAAGSDRIPGVLLQVLHNALDRGMSIQSAVAAPRLSYDREAGKGVLYGEGDDRADVHSLYTHLESRGIAVHSTPPGQVLGRVHALMRRPDGTWAGAPDPRWFGVAVTPLR